MRIEGKKLFKVRGRFEDGDYTSWYDKPGTDENNVRKNFRRWCRERFGEYPSEIFIGEI
tara:strand:- start:480 stop:656 length:177 start_codon:yes stop_codon:yes gene_type:complete